MVLAAISGTKHTHSIRTGHGNTDAGTPNTYFAWNYVTDEIIQNKNMFFFLRWELTINTLAAFGTRLKVNKLGIARYVSLSSSVAVVASNENN